MSWTPLLSDCGVSLVAHDDGRRIECWPQSSHPAHVSMARNVARNLAGQLNETGEEGVIVTTFLARRSA